MKKNSGKPLSKQPERYYPELWDKAFLPIMEKSAIFPMGPPATRWQKFKYRFIEAGRRIKVAWRILRHGDDEINHGVDLILKYKELFK
jgi:hypothetical protein